MKLGKSADRYIRHAHDLEEKAFNSSLEFEQTLINALAALLELERHILKRRRAGGTENVASKTGLEPQAVREQLLRRYKFLNDLMRRSDRRRFMCLEDDGVSDAAVLVRYEVYG